ncbi:MAG: sigma-54-dependent Fis family transcriptional regulator [Deltaproteobacteria bacterium RIFOXYD12_FULL_57_12]|nr:MAG: sigma-54-dependent Fis family transcriptional regulator [Deltaproteobacteria bacterium RIFOXYD12_FULL_57_12]
MARKALVIDDDRNILTTLLIHLESLGFETCSASTGAEGIRLFMEEKPQVVFLDLKLPDQDGLSVLEALAAAEIKSYIVVITAYATIDTAVRAIKMGAFDYLPKPFTPVQVSHMVDMIDKICAMEAEIASLKGIVREGGLITRNHQMHKIVAMARQVADSNASVFLSGESGTGKGLLARLIHDLSPRAVNPFVTVNCAMLQENLLESDLFGHVKGAFTGALRDKIGKLELAAAGTVFLDEVSEMSTTIQAKFLHFLQYREFERLGDPKTIQVDVRMIAATNRDLEEQVAAGLFRKDLYFRLNVVEIHVPSLRERPDDIELLASHFLKHFARLNRKPAMSLDVEALQLLQAYSWPGNVRELVNVIERGTILARYPYIITPIDLPAHIANYLPRQSADADMKTLAEMEKNHINQVLSQSSSIDEAAKVLGIDPATLWRKRKRLQLD